MRTKKEILVMIFTALICMLPILAMAQDPGDNPDAPLDGGTSLLVAAGVGYGIKKVKEARKKKK